jgi:hypothetical protein
MIERKWKERWCIKEYWIHQWRYALVVCMRNVTLSRLWTTGWKHWPKGTDENHRTSVNWAGARQVLYLPMLSLLCLNLHISGDHYLTEVSNGRALVYLQDIISGDRRKQHKSRREERCNLTFAPVCTHPMASSAVFCLSLQIREYILRRSSAVALEPPIVVAILAL